MALDVKIDSNFDQTRAALAALPKELQPATLDRVRRAAEQLRDLMRDDMHEVTGRMKRGVRIVGPLPISAGALEARIGPFDVAYAPIEAERGDDHDFVARTLNDADAILSELADDLEGMVVKLVEGR